VRRHRWGHLSPRQGREGQGQDRRKVVRDDGACGFANVRTRNVRIVRETSRSNDSTPSHRVSIDRTETGAAWRRSRIPGKIAQAIPAARVS
jgi:hypothetical protein